MSAAGSERGAILVQTAVMLVGLTAMSAFVVDYGILWTARRQVQNTADAAAMAAATSLAFEAPDDFARARANALAAVANNRVWGQVVPVTASDITFPECPPSRVGTGRCVRVQVLRTVENAAALPTIFGALVGVTAQGVRAAATAQVLHGDAATCVKPIAVPDRWDDIRNPQGAPGWDVNDIFERYSPTGQLLPGPVDIYQPPAGGSGPNGTGYSRSPNGVSPGDYGLRFEFNPTPDPYADRATGAHFVPVEMDAPGPAAFLAALRGCSPRLVQPGIDMNAETGSVLAEVSQGVNELLAADPNARWDPSLYGGRGGVAGGCMAAGACPSPAGGTTPVSPRLIAVPVYDPDAWDQNPTGTAGIVVSRLAGFFIEGFEAPAFVSGRLMVYPSIPRSTMTSNPTSAFVTSITLVR